MTEPDEVSGDVNAYFQKMTLPETGKTVYKCSFKLDKDIQKSRDARVLQFKNYIEEWEADRIGLKNDKYMHMYLYDEGEVRRVVDIVWATTSRPAKYQVVTQFIETINADDLINADQDNVNYLINAELHQCINIKAARDIPNKPYNFEVELVSAEED